MSTDATRIPGTPGTASTAHPEPEPAWPRRAEQSTPAGRRGQQGRVGQADRAPSQEALRLTRALLACGVAAGPLFTVVAAVQVLTRDGFDLGKHPLSLLSLGTLGWIQVANFVVAGLLSLAAAAGMRRTVPAGRGGYAGRGRVGTRHGHSPGAVWAARLVGVYGVALVAAGVFVTDPSMGYPAGAPKGAPDELSAHAIVHGIAAPLAFLSLVAACFVRARGYSLTGRRLRSVVCGVSGLAVVVTLAVPDQDSLPVRMAVASVFAFGWLSAVTSWLIADVAARRRVP